MRYVSIPGTDLTVSQLCLGSTDMGGKLSVDESLALLDEFAALGGTFIDTAHVYSNWLPGPKSISERTIGQWMRDRGVRDRIVIGTKGAHPELDTMHVSRLSPAEIEQDLTESLEYLQTDRIDLYWLHRDDVSIPVGEIVDILAAQVSAGRIRYFGASNWSAARLQAALDYAARAGIVGFVANQPQWSIAAADMSLNADKTTTAMDADALAFHRRTGLTAVPYSSQALGFFTKLNAGGPSAVEGSRYAIYNSDTNHRRLTAIQALARRYGVPINDIVLAYLWSQPFTTIPIIGSKTVAQLRDSIRAVDLVLTPDDLAEIERA